MTTGILWFRQDLRLNDNLALCEACTLCDELLCVFIDDPQDQTISQLGAASRVWLHHSLAALQLALQEKGTRLFFAQGRSEAVLKKLIEQSGASRIFWNRCYDPVSIERDKNIKSRLSGLSPRTFNSLLIHEPWENLKADGSAYRVYTPYWRAAIADIAADEQRILTLSVPSRIPPLNESTARKLSDCVPLVQLRLLPDVHWHQAMMSYWQVGEAAALARVEQFLETDVRQYQEGRNLPSQAVTSRLSPHLHFGEISPRYVLSRLLLDRKPDALCDDEITFAKEVVWREFAYCLLYHFPHTIDQPLDRRFEKFPWILNSDDHLQRWQRGLTGVPIIDAGMRELYATGWMHNRVRMIVASYLIKNLLIPWQQGEQWFRDTLVDADLASNSMGWQWTAGCGADAAPYFRVFNPVLQGEKFDPNGEYVKRWVPEVADVPIRYLHKPWELDEAALAKLNYPQPLVDLKKSRQRALDAFSMMKGNISR